MTWHRLCRSCYLTLCPDAYGGGPTTHGGVSYAYEREKYQGRVGGEAPCCLCSTDTKAEKLMPFTSAEIHPRGGAQSHGPRAVHHR